MMDTERITSAARLAELREPWRQIAAATPLLGPAWLMPWWRHYGEPAPDVAGPRQLDAVALFDQDKQLVALAPWYVEQTRLHGNVMRFLGVGEACTDYLGIPCRPGYERAAGRFLADALLTEDVAMADSPARLRRRWGMLDFSHIDSQCLVMRALLLELENRGALVRRREAAQGWRIPLPASWDEYVARLSKSHRKQVRRMGRRLLADDRLKYLEVLNLAELPRALDTLVRLHGERRANVGEPNLFARERFARFHREATRELLAAGQLRLSCVELGGTPIAAEYHVYGGQVVYAYQSGIDPAHLRAEPGRLATIATIQAAIARGDRSFDFMRGDEPYKAHWRAEPRAMYSARIWPGTVTDWVRHEIYRAGERVRALVRDCRTVAGIPSSNAGGGRRAG